MYICIYIYIYTEVGAEAHGCPATAQASRMRISKLKQTTERACTAIVLFVMLMLT